MSSKSIQAARLALETLDAAKRAVDFAVECVEEEMAEKVRAAMDGCPGNVVLVHLYEHGEVNLQKEIRPGSIRCVHVHVDNEKKYDVDARDRDTLEFAAKPDVAAVLREAIEAAKKVRLFRRSCNVPVTLNKK